MTPLEPSQRIVFERADGHLHATGSWPRLETLQRELASENRDVSVRAVVMAAQAYAGIGSPHDEIRLTLRGLAAVAAAQPLLHAYLRALQSMIERYRNTAVDARYASSDLADLELDPAVERELSQLLRDDGWAFGSGGDSDGGWSFEISDRVLGASTVSTVAELLAVRFGEPMPEEPAPVAEAEPLRSTDGAKPVIDSDRPITAPSDDLLGRVPLARALAVIAAADLGGQGFVMGLTGPWGSGKTSVLNLMAATLDQEKTAYVVRFDPWLFSSSEELVWRFMREVSIQLQGEQQLGDAAARIGEYAQILAPLAALAAAPWLAPVLVAGGSVAGRWRKKPAASAQEQRRKVAAALRKLDRRLVVLIDDLDRLEMSEIRDVVRLVKLVGDFPNTTYVLAYDQRRVANALGDGDEEDGQEFLEKIIQISHEVPPADPQQLGRVLADSMSKAIGDINRYRFDQAEYTNLFSGARALFTTVRDIRRYTNRLPTTLALVGREVELAEVLALEALHVRLPRCFARIVAAKQVLTEPRSEGLGGPQVSDERAKTLIDEIVGAAGPFEDEVAAIVRRLFPAAGRHLGGSSYGSEWLGVWRQAGRVAHPEVFDIYLHGALPAGVLPAALVEDAFQNLQDRDALTALLDGVSGDALESLLARLEHYEKEFPTDKLEVPVSVLFNQQHRLLRGRRHVFDIGAEYAVPRLVLRLLRKCDHAEVARVTRVALPQIISLSERGHLIRMVGYRENSGHKLVSEDDAALLEAALFDELLAAEGGELAQEHDLIHLLWWAHQSRPTDIVDRVQALVDDDEFLLGLLRAALGETVGQGMGDAAVTVSHNLDWRSLTEFVPHDRLAARVREVDVPEVRESLDERATLALQLARKCADDPVSAEQDRDQTGP
jgi:predicted KAP-like P-loop ATPase